MVFIQTTLQNIERLKHRRYVVRKSSLATFLKLQGHQQVRYDIPNNLKINDKLKFVFKILLLACET